MKLLSRLAVVIVALGSVSVAQADLISRLDGAAAYDDVLQITWLTDADLSGPGTWQDQLDWVSSLNTANHLGFDDWRLALMSVSTDPGGPPGTTVNSTAFDCAKTTELVCRDNELEYMFYHNMGGNFLDDKSGDQTVNGVLLSDVATGYWSGTKAWSTGEWIIWDYSFQRGRRGTVNESVTNVLYGWAVRSGDVVSVPEPSTLALLGIGLFGMGLARRRKAV